MLKLTEQESIILRDICFARMKVLRAGDPRAPEELPLHTELTESVARQALPVFDSAKPVGIHTPRHAAAMPFRI